MSDTKIEWAEKVWNPIVGCTVHSPGCTNCYAMRMAWRLQGMAAAGNDALAHYAGTVTKTKAGPVWTGKIGIAPDSAFLAPLHRRTPTTYFVNSMADLFHKDVPDEVIDRVFAVMALCPQHTFQVLTKRSARMREYLSRPGVEVRIGLEALGLAMNDKANNLKSQLGAGIKLKGSDINPGALVIWPLPNVWAGVSGEDQARADERIPDLLATPAAVRWISAEPLLGPVDIAAAMTTDAALEVLFAQTQARMERGESGDPRGSLHWVVAGGESGPGARGSTEEVEANMRSLLAQCRSAGVPFFGKQNFKKLPLPDDLMVKEYPARLQEPA